LRTRTAADQVFVPDAHPSRVNNLPVCDPFGAALGSATLPGGSVTSCHDGCAAALFDVIEASGLRMEREPKLFTSLIPVGSLMGPGAPHHIRPDAFVDVAMPTANPARRGGGRRPKQGASTTVNRQLVDVKTIYGGTRQYASARAALDQSGAVDTRAEAVDTDYRAHARKIDQHCFRCPTCPSARTAQRCAACNTFNHVSDALAAHGTVRGAVFGQYGEASLDVHTLINAASRERARLKWRRYGASSQDEAYARIVAVNRRVLGVAVVREFARHRLRRLAFVGLTVAQVRQAREEVNTPHVTRGVFGPEEADYFRFLHGARAGAGMPA